MNIFQAIILGLIQGLTEFLPVSSSGHLVLVPYFFNWPQQDISFDVALHFGTSLAVLLFFYRDWIDMLLSFKNDFFAGKYKFDEINNLTKNLFTILIVSIPVGLVGILFDDYVESFFRNPISVAIMLIIVSFVMLAAESYYKKIVPKNTITFFDALIISLSQILALIPGTSRSGITISAGLFRKINREDAAKFSFLLATPIILGATLIKLPDLFSGGNFFYIAIGILTSFLSGLFAIKFLINFLKRNNLNIFIVYRIILGIIILVVVL